MKNRLEKAVQDIFRGGGGGGDGSNQTDDNLFSRDSVELALALSEGPIKGLVDGGKTFSLGDTPLVSQSGSPNFHPVALEMRYGYDDDKPLDFKLGGDSNNVNVGVRLLQNAAVVRTTEQVLRGKINRLQVRLNFSTLYTQNDNGTYNATADFQIAYKPSAQTAWQYVGNTTQLTLTGKTTSGYIKEFNIDVPVLTDDDWDIQVTKYNADSSTSTFVDITWESFQEITTSQQAFPDTAIAHLVGQASGQFSGIPEISGIYDGMLFQIPSNYNPYTHTFDETLPWDGSFKLDWTNNPALVLYNLIINTRYGLAKYYPHATANRYDFYNAAKWCDEQVPDGKGGTQPRYTFNAVLTEGMVGKQLLDYIAGSFNAIVYDDATGTIHLKLDQWKEPSMLFTPETVTPEGFTYSYSDIATRYNDITVTFLNPDLDYNEDRRRVFDQTEIDANGTIPLDFQAVGCTDVNEALRKAQYRMLTSIREVTTVTFSTTRLGIMLGLFDNIWVADPLMGWGSGGRIKSVNGTVVNLRDPIHVQTIGNFNMRVQDVGNTVEVTVAPANTGDCYQLNIVSGTLPNTLPDRTQFTVEDSVNGIGFAKPFRVLSVQENQGADSYTITALEVDQNKYADADNLTNTTASVPYSFVLERMPLTPIGLTATAGTSELQKTKDGKIVSRIFAAWGNPANSYVKCYEFRWREANSGSWQTQTVYGTQVYVGPVTDDTSYDIQVRSIGYYEGESPWTPILTITASGKTAAPNPLTNLTAVGDIFQNIISFSFPADLDLATIELQSSATNDVTTATALTTLAFPTAQFKHVGLLPNQTVYYWARVKDTSGNWSPLFPSTTTGVGATVSADPARILALLDSAITTSQLAKALQDDIANVQDVSGLVTQLESNAADMIAGWISLNDNMDENRSNVKRLDGIDGEILTINDNITTEQTARQSLSTTVDGLSSSLTTEQSTRLSADQANSQSITNLTSTVNSNKSSADQSIATLTSTTNSQAQTISSLQSSVGTNTSAISTEQQTRANADSSLSARMDTLVASSGGNTAGLDSETQARINGDNALTDQVNSLTTTVNNNDSKQSANLTTEQTTRANGDSANAASITSLQGTVDSNNSAVNARIDNVLALNLDASTALMTRFSSLDATISSNNSTVTGQINDIQNLNLTSTTALMTRFSGLDSTVSNNYNTLNGKYADILNLNIASGTTLMTKINTMQSSINGNTASISTNASALASVQNGVTTLNAQMVFKADAYGHIAGIGLASTGTDASNATSSVLIYADKIGFLLPGAGAGATPIPVFTSGYVNGVATTGINGAVFVDGSITAKSMNVAALSAITANIGTVTAGMVQSANAYRFVNLNASGSDRFLQVRDDATNTDQFYIQADGVGFLARKMITPPLVMESGTFSGSYTWTDSHQKGDGTIVDDQFHYLIHTGLNDSVTDWRQTALNSYVARAQASSGTTTLGYSIEGMIQCEVFIYSGLSSGQTGYTDVNGVTWQRGDIGIHMTWRPFSTKGTIDTWDWALMKV